jgi:hypothetical protein
MGIPHHVGLIIYLKIILFNYRGNMELLKNIAPQKIEAYTNFHF